MQMLLSPSLNWYGGLHVQKFDNRITLTSTSEAKDIKYFQ